MEGSKIQHMEVTNVGRGACFMIPKVLIDKGLVKRGVRYTLVLIEEKQGDEKP